MTGRLLEKQIENMILQWANMVPGVWARKQHTTGMWDPDRKVFRTLKGYAERGVSDIDIKILKAGTTVGHFGVIEVKTEANAKACQRKYGFPCTPDQYAYIEKIKYYGGFGGVAWSLPMAQEILEPHL